MFPDAWRLSSPAADVVGRPASKGYNITTLRADRVFAKEIQVLRSRSRRAPRDELLAQGSDLSDGRPFSTGGPPSGDRGN
jgi:hypothetical protein